MGQTGTPTEPASRSALRQRLSLRRDLPSPRRGGSPGVTLCRHRHDAASPRRNLTQRRRRRPRRSHPRQSRMAHDEQTRRARQHHADLPAFPRPGTEPGRERLAISPPELALEHRLRRLRRHRRRRMRRLAKAHRPTRNNHLHRIARLGSRRSAVMTFSITSALTAFVLSRMMPGGCAVSETRKIAAILVSDVVGYSRLAGADEDRTLARLRALRSDLIDPTISVHHGRIVKRTGDGSIIEFNSVVDAVRCAIEVQHAMVERNAGVALEKRIQFRIGIHLGDIVEESDGDLMGDGVNIAARLEGLCEPGGVCLSEDAHRQVRDRLKENFVDLGERQLKNIARPVRAYALPAAAIAGSRDQGPQATAPRAVRDGGRWIGVIAACVVALLAVGAFAWRAGYAPRFMAASVADKLANAPRLSIVVLPFENLSGDKEQDYFADGITDDLTTDLSHLDGSFVIARNTAFTYKGKPADVKQIGRELGVRYLLEGAVRRLGENVEINAQLISTETGAHVWADRFEGERGKLGELQLEVVSRLANSLGVELVKAEALRASVRAIRTPSISRCKPRSRSILMRLTERRVSTKQWRCPSARSL